MKKIERMNLQIEGRFESSEKATQALRILMIFLRRKGFVVRHMDMVSDYEVESSLGLAKLPSLDPVPIKVQNSEEVQQNPLL